MPPEAPRASGTSRPILVRDARPDERTLVRDLTLRAYGEYAVRMTSPAWIALRDVVRGTLDGEHDAERLVAEHDGKVVGSVYLYAPAADAYAGLTARIPVPELRLLAVLPEARGLGVGRALVEECIRRARISGARELGLHTSVSMSAARQLYASMGFVRVPGRDFTVEGSELVEGFALPL